MGDHARQNLKNGILILILEHVKNLLTVDVKAMRITSRQRKNVSKNAISVNFQNILDHVRVAFRNGILILILEHVKNLRTADAKVMPTISQQRKNVLKNATYANFQKILDHAKHILKSGILMPILEHVQSLFMVGVKSMQITSRQRKNAQWSANIKYVNLGLLVRC